MKLSPQMKRLMSPSDQERYFGPDLAPDPVKVSAEAAKLEREEQRTFQRELCRLENDGLLRFHWQRTDKPATGRLGTLDFVVYGPGGKTAHLEFKSPQGRLTREQQTEYNVLRGLAHTVKIMRSAKEAIAWLRNWL